MSIISKISQLCSEREKINDEIKKLDEQLEFPLSKEDGSPKFIINVGSGKYISMKLASRNEVYLDRGEIEKFIEIWNRIKNDLII